MSNHQEQFIIWEAPKIEKPEFRLYYDENGNVVCYCGDKSATGNYIVIDTQTFAEARSDIRVIDGKITVGTSSATVYKLMPNIIEGTTCHTEDISIVVDKNETHTKWKMNNYEL
jgi:hypothetical protein